MTTPVQTQRQAQPPVSALSFCLRDSAFALHLRHPVGPGILQSFLRFQFLHPENFLGTIQLFPMIHIVTLQRKHIFLSNLHFVLLPKIR